MQLIFKNALNLYTPTDKYYKKLKKITFFNERRERIVLSISFFYLIKLKRY